MRDKKLVVDASKRTFIKRAGTLAVTAPAAAMILSAASRPALAQVPSGQRPVPTDPQGPV